MKKTIILIFIVIFKFSYSNGPDSLFNLLKKSGKYQKARIYNELGDFYVRKNIDSAFLFYRKSFDLYKKSKDFKSIIEILHKQASLYLRLSELDSALILYKTALDYALKSRNDSLLALAYHKVGNGYYFIGILDSAAQFYLKSIDIREKIRDSLGIANIYNNLGVVYKKLNNKRMSLFYFQKAKDWYEKINDSADVAMEFNNIGVIYWSLQKYDSAEYFFQKALNFAKKTNNIYEIGNRLNNLGVLYREKGEYRKAVNYLTMALNYYEQEGFLSDIANVYNNLGAVYTRLNIFDSAYYFLNKAKTIAFKKKMNNRLKDIYLYFNEYFSQLNRWDSAYIYLNLYSRLKDSLYQEDIAKQIDELRTKYQTEKYQKELIIKDLKLKKAKTITLLLVGFSSVFLVMSLLLFALFRQKRKANIILTQQKQEILQQKEEILTQAEQLRIAFDNIRKQKEKIENQNLIINQINQKLTDSIKSAKKIQEAMLPFIENISEYFEVFIIFKPKDIVSGDFYWFSKPIEYQGHTYLFAAVVDCTGHGVPGAFMSMIGMRMIGEFINEHKIISPAQVLENMDKLTISALKQDISDDRNGMDVCLVRFEKIESGLNVVFAGAKRDLFYFVPKENKIFVKKGTRRNIGGGIKRSFKPFENIEFQTDIKTIFYLTSDGYIDQSNPSRKRFGSIRFMELLQKIGNLPLQEQKQLLETELEKWMEHTEQRDDITIIGLKIKN